MWQRRSARGCYKCSLRLNLHLSLVVARTRNLVLLDMKAGCDTICSGAEPPTTTDRTRSALADMRQMQIKTLSFLAYVMRQAHNIIRGHQVHLLSDVICPSMHIHQVAQCACVLIAAPVETSNKGVFHSVLTRRRCGVTGWRYGGAGAHAEELP